MADATPKPVIFLACANDRDDTVGYLRNLPDEARRLREVLNSAEQASLCEVVVRSNSTAGDIFKVFQDPKFRDRIAIFHYSGHANGYQLLLESPEGKAAAADAGGLAKFLGQQQGLHLVFLNGCSTQQQTEGLLDANISAVISTSRAIEDQVATDFSYQFYQGLAGGASIRTAYNEAEASIQTSKGGNTRGLYFGAKDDASNQPEADRWPWNLYLRPGSEIADQWNLPEAVNDPLFGLPSLPEQDLPESPYRHLNWFTHKDAEVFFGRGHQIRELYDRLTAPRTAPIMLFYGQSGVGKSSILDAGLIPRLEQNYEVRYLRRTTGGLLDTLQRAFLPEAADVPIETAWRVKEEQTGKPLIVFLDQVEELYTRPIADLPNELDQLLEVVKATFVESGQRPRGKLVLGFRKEWLAELEMQLVACELPRSKVFLEPLDRLGIIEVVEGPARSERLRERYGLTVEDGLAEIIADDLLADRDSAIAPTLQILLTKMWAKATEENYEHPEFSRELYQQLKRDGILLRDFLNQQIAAFRESYPEAVDSGLLLDIVALHTTPLGTADQRTVEQLQEQYAHLGVTLQDVLQRCQDLHLLTVAASAQKESTKTTRLAHDTLAPLVREQFDVSDKPGQRARRILDNRSVDWTGEQTGTALDGADLAIVEHGANGTRALNSTEQRLLKASRELRARLNRTRKILKIAGAIAVTLIVVAAVIAVKQRADAVVAKGKAERNFDRAIEAVDTALTGISEALEDYPGVQAMRRKLLEEAAENYARFATEVDDDPDLQAEAARAFLRLGKVHSLLGDWEPAELAYRSAENRLTKLLDDKENNADLQFDLAAARTKLGTVYRNRGNMKAASAAFHSAEDLFDELVKRHPDTLPYREARAGNWLEWSQWFDESGNMAEARKLLEKAESEYAELFAAAGQPRFLRGLASTRGALAQTLDTLGQSDKAFSMLQNAVADWQGLTQDDPDEPSFAEGLARARVRLAHALTALHREGDAIKTYREAIHECDVLVQSRPDVPRYRELSAVTQNSLARALHRQGQNREAIELSREADVQFQLLARIHPNVPHYILEDAANLVTLGSIQRDLEFYRDAASQYQTALVSYDQLVEHYPDRPDYREHRAVCRTQLARLLHTHGPEEDHEVAQRQFEEAIVDLEEIVRKHSDNIYFRDALAWCHNYLGDLHHDKNRPAEAKKHFEIMFEQRERLATSSTSPDQRNRLAWVLVNCVDESLRDPNRAIELATKAADDVPLSAAYPLTIGVAYYRAGKWKESIRARQDAIELRAHEDSRDSFYLAMAYWQQGNQSEAKDRFEHAKQIMLETRPGSFELQTLRDEAAKLLESTAEDNGPPQE